MTDLVPTDYEAFLASLKDRVKTARVRAAVSANRELVLLYWGIGRDILARQAAQGWGARVIERLSRDLRREFPDMKGFSPRNLKYMRAFAEAWPDEPIVQHTVARLPWGHLVRILDRAREPEARRFYVEQALVQGSARELCRAKNRVVAECALRDIDKPIGVADLHLTRLLLEGFQESLPTVEAIEAELHDLPEPGSAKE